MILTETLSNLDGEHFIKNVDRVVSTIEDTNNCSSPPHPDNPRDRCFQDGQAMIRKRSRISTGISAMKAISPIPISHLQGLSTVIRRILQRVEHMLNVIRDSATHGISALSSQYAINSISKNWTGVTLNCTTLPSKRPSLQLHIGNSTPVRYAQLFEYLWFALVRK